MDYSVDMDALAATLGLSYINTFQIKFQQYDNYPIDSDGRGWDAVSITVDKPQVDWYEITADAGELLTVQLAKHGIDGNAFVALHDPARVVLADGIAQAGEVQQVIIDYVVPVTGTYLVSVTGIATDYTLVATRDTLLLDAIPGDSNLDCQVGLIDLDILGSNFNQSGGWMEGDFSGDGMVSLLDLDILGSNWGAGAMGLNIQSLTLQSNNVNQQTESVVGDNALAAWWVIEEQRTTVSSSSELIFTNSLLKNMLDNQEDDEPVQLF